MASVLEGVGAGGLGKIQCKNMKQAKQRRYESGSDGWMLLTRLHVGNLACLKPIAVQDVSRACNREGKTRRKVQSLLSNYFLLGGCFSGGLGVFLKEIPKTPTAHFHSEKCTNIWAKFMAKIAHQGTINTFRPYYCSYVCLVCLLGSKRLSNFLAR